MNQIGSIINVKEKGRTIEEEQIKKTNEKAMKANKGTTKKE